ncbi:MAG TPA: ABC transporter permease [Gemmataceae bacterium]|jgi:ABC-2 type transport system permease protein|nr:ABC transporter permease [Gemmataceae bacterium]
MLRTLRWSTWLGWQIESNWADPWLFTLYLIIKPITGSLVLVFMFFAARAVAQTPPEYLSYVYVSNACFGLVGTVMFGMSYVVITDREHYGMLKYIFISPARLQTYLLGRGIARALEGIVGGGLTVVAGMLLFAEVRSSVTAGIDWAWLAAFLLIGGAMLYSAGMMLASVVFNTHRNGMFLSEGIAGVVYLLSGVIFPLTELPRWLQGVSLALPTTYWLEGMRRALMGMPPEGSNLAKSPLTSFSNWELAGALAITTVGLTFCSQWLYRWSLWKAWRNGKIEEQSGM